MSQYNLSQIMRTAHNLRKNCPAKYTTFAQALKKSWSMAKFRRTMEANRTGDVSTRETILSEIQERAERVTRIKTERAEALAKQIEEEKRERIESAARVEAECNAYGYGRGNHYSSFGGWGNYCGD